MSKTAKRTNPTKVVTGVVRLSYANVWEPKSINGGAEKYSVSLIIPKSDTKTLSAINEAVNAVKEKLGVPVVSGMYPENPGVDIYKKYAYIIETANSAVGMRKAVSLMAKLAMKLARGEQIGFPDEEGYIPRGIRKNLFAAKQGSKRAVEMLINKLKGDDYNTEYKMPVFDRVSPSAAIKDITKAKVALISSGGPVPKGNPDHIESSSASKYGKYSLRGIDDLNPENSETAHGGYDPVYANEDLDRVLPVDVLQEMEKAGEIGSLHEYWYATVGNGTSVKNFFSTTPSLKGVVVVAIT
jgi:betaine reductase